MLNLEKIKIEYCMNQLRFAYRRNYNDMERELGNILVWSAHLALENIANTDALYHNVEHTMLVALAGQAILEGKHLAEGGVTPKDWAHFMIALLFHDIGYVKGVCRTDSEGSISSGIGDEIVNTKPGGTDAALAPYHVDRSKQFVRERFGTGMIREGLVDAEVILSYIEMTRYPVPEGDYYRDTVGYPGLVRAADYIGQLGDPYHAQKCTGLFYEFQELGVNEKLGYQTPGDLRRNNAKFYWEVVNQYIQEALRYLRVTQDGKQWIANLQANVFGSEHGCSRWPNECLQT